MRRSGRLDGQPKGSSIARQFRLAQKLFDGKRVNLRVLAYVQSVQMEAEGFYLSQERIEQCGCQTFATVFDKALPDEHKVCPMIRFGISSQTLTEECGLAQQGVWRAIEMARSKKPARSLECPLRPYSTFGEMTQERSGWAARWVCIV